MADLGPQRAEVHRAPHRTHVVVAAHRCLPDDVYARLLLTDPLLSWTQAQPAGTCLNRLSIDTRRQGSGTMSIAAHTESPGMLGCEFRRGPGATLLDPP